ncbi:hypothetical protein EJ08DRAFT_652714 [Tothia fuscella]|uniref:Tat pathway signal sequence n=1 Tax=Tothia fuscella TaxID=1048955 RepID=A0A9P4TV96_9PEZI|nr:hypothetical protein EJ08DRAFT_652714 [Tothia fuscella]
MFNFWHQQNRRLVGIAEPTTCYTDDAESLLPRNGKELKNETDSKKGSTVRRSLILVFTHFFVAAIAVLLSNMWRIDLDSTCAKHTSHFSPVVKHVDIKYAEVQYNGSFFHEEIYRNDPSPEVDDAWKALGIDYRALRVPESEAQKSGLAKDQVKIRAEHGGGYPGNVEGLHHLHCLNLLRQTSHYNFGYYKKLGQGAFTNNDYIVKSHVTHCMDILRQQLMCTVDTGVLGQVWVDPKGPAPFVDFNTKHTCKNFDAIRRWAEENQLPEVPPKNFLEPPMVGGRIYPETP